MMETGRKDLIVIYRIIILSDQYCWPLSAAIPRRHFRPLFQGAYEWALSGMSFIRQARRQEIIKSIGRIK
jgi:hypothetical protein